jgi:hypothetical protein
VVSLSSLMTLPSAVSDLLMRLASFRRPPAASVSRRRSLPARSTMLKRDVTTRVLLLLLLVLGRGLGLDWEEGDVSVVVVASSSQLRPPVLASSDTRGAGEEEEVLVVMVM